jgi:DNA-binding MarR family transcriptional regulator
MDDAVSAQIDVAGSETGQQDLRIWLRLLACTNLIETRVRKGLRESFDTTLPRFDLMAQLSRAAGGMTMGELSRRLMVSNGNVTGLIDRLVAERLVERRTDETDRRAQRVRLTAAGRRAFDAMTPVHQAWVAEALTPLDAADKADLLSLLSKLKSALSSDEARS